MTRTNNVLIGVFFILAGFLFLLRNLMPFNIGYLLTAVAGIEMLISHFRTKGLFSMIIGSFLSYWGILNLLSLNGELHSAFISAMVYFVPAFIFFILYIERQKRGYLTCICLFILLGVDVVINHLTGFDAIGTLLICVGIAFLLDYFFGRTYVYTSRLYLGIFLISIGIFKMMDWHIYLNFILPAALIWIGIVFFIKAIGRK